MTGIKLNRIFFISIHFVLGYLLTLPVIPTIVVHSLYFIAIFHVIANRNRNQEALLWSMYFVSAEVLFRMSNGLILYESVKYIIMILLIIGMAYEKQKRLFPLQYVMYLLLMMIGIAFTEIPASESFRKTILFNLSGPILLGISAIYHYNRKIDISTIYKMLFWTFLPILSILIYLYIKTPSIKEIVFGSVANFDTSGGFGPNQVATDLGFGIFILSVLLIIRKRFTGYLVLDIAILMYLVYRGLLTFSRGGIIAGIVSLVAFSYFYNLTLRNRVYNNLKYIVITIIIGLSIWMITSNITGGMLDNRYSGKNTRGEKKEDISSGRIDIFKTDTQFFLENPIFGIGVGSGKFKRMEDEENMVAASHNEIGRLLSEHGLIGLFLLIMLLMIPIFHFIKIDNFNRAWIISFFLLWFLTINHSAMRLAFPGFIYGLSLLTINYASKENSIHR